MIPDLIAAAVPLIASAIIIAVMLLRPAGNTVTVRTDSGSYEYPLSGDRVIETVSNGIRLRIVIEGGRVCVEEAECPDKICVRTGEISRVGQSIVCVPAEVVIRITGEGSDEDFIVG